jgi:hypothetical protein
MTKDPIFDRKFVGAATVIGGVYASIVVALAEFIGKEAAGVAGVALTALATAIFKQFETLRFKEVLSDPAEVEIPRVLSWRMLVVVLAFLSVQVLWSFLVSGVGLIFGWEFNTSDSLSVAVLLITAYMIGGAIILKSFPNASYSYATIGALGAHVVNAIMDFVRFAVNDMWSSVDWATSLKFWLLVPVSALIGARLGRIGATLRGDPQSVSQPPNPTTAPDD